MKNNHLILEFSHVYCDENIPKNTGIHWLDCSEIEECDLYCSRQAEEKIREKIKPYGIHGIHFLDSGNYHYVTEIMTSQIQKEFQLVVFDHHTDMQKPMIEHMTSCGDWAGKVLETNPWLQQLVLIGPQESDIEQLYRENDGLMNHKEIAEKLLTFSAEEIRSGEDKNKISKIKKNLLVYISIDKDILDKQYTETNWSQGNMSLQMLERLLSHLDNTFVGPVVKKEVQYIPSFGHLRYDLLQNIVDNPEYKNLVISILKQFDEDIVDICYTKADDGSFLETVITEDGVNMPFSVYGDGIKKILYILNKLFDATDSILLIDEIETGLHKKYYDKLFPVVFELAKKLNVQLFIATHSMEAIDAILEYGKYDDIDNKIDPIKVITLKKVESKDGKGSNVVARNVDGQYVYENRKAFEFEVRL